MDGKKQILFEKLKKKNAFWSYNDMTEADDEQLIEKVMLLLDIDEIDNLFRIYDKDYIKHVWEERILRQEPYFHGLNRFFAWFYFGIDDPDEFLNRREKYLH